MHIAVIGAGISGVTAARTLLDAGHTVEVFEKSRGPSGRISTRRSESWQADHGAQYFTAKRPDFQAQVEDWCQQGLAAEWTGRIENQGPRPPIPRYVAVPRMNALVTALAAPLKLHSEFTLAALTQSGSHWQLSSKEHGAHPTPFDAVILSIPSPQLTPFEPLFPAAWREVIHANTYSPCWTVMAGYTEPLTLDFDGRFMDEPSPLSWVARNHSKPGRTGRETWTLHGSPRFSTEHLEDDPAPVTDTLVAAFCAVGGRRPDWVQTHRWRYALATNPLAPAEQTLWSPDLRLGLCGDWLSDGRIEGAWRSGLHCANKLAERSA
jgi:predicted NAD/FAD-dependent oxidoreductase